MVISLLQVKNQDSEASGGPWGQAQGLIQGSLAVGLASETHAWPSVSFIPHRQGHVCPSLCLPFSLRHWQRLT